MYYLQILTKYWLTDIQYIEKYWLQPYNQYVAKMYYFQILTRMYYYLVCTNMESYLAGITNIYSKYYICNVSDLPACRRSCWILFYSHILVITNHLQNPEQTVVGELPNSSITEFICISNTRGERSA